MDPGLHGELSGSQPARAVCVGCSRCSLQGAGQTLPIWRGGGIDQPLLLDMARQIAAGHWAHIFPEARVVQSGELGQDPITKRSPDDLRRLGVLKWGVGKLIAHGELRVESSELGRRCD